MWGRTHRWGRAKTFSKINKSKPSYHLNSINYHVADMLSRLSLPLFRPNGITTRALATASNTNTKNKNKKLPLAGLKVLDLSRVLAGVCICLASHKIWT